MFDCVLKHKWMFLFKECMAGDVNLFFDDSQQEVAEIEIMIAGMIIYLLWFFFTYYLLQASNQQNNSLTQNYLKDQRFSFLSFVCISF